MKIEKLNDNQIRCILTKDDLASRQIKLSELAYGSEKTRELFQDMMEQAAIDVGFEADNIPLMIEAIPLPNECRARHNSGRRRSRGRNERECPESPQRCRARYKPPMRGCVRIAAPHSSKMSYRPSGRGAADECYARRGTQGCRENRFRNS